MTPGSQVQIDLSNLPADYDLVLFKDISKAYNKLTTPSDLTKLSAEFAGQAFTGQAFTGQAFTGQAFTGQAFTADSFSGQAFTGQAFTGQAFTGQAFTGQAFTGQAFTGQAFTGQAFTGQAFTGQAFTGQAFTGQAFTGQAFTGGASAGQAFTPQAFTSAQTRSGLAVSAATGLGPESITENTWNETGYFYVRVTGRDGAFDPSRAFSLHVNQTGTSCDGVHPIGAAPAAAADNGVKTVILTDSSRIVGIARRQGRARDQARYVRGTPRSRWRRRRRRRGPTDRGPERAGRRQLRVPVCQESRRECPQGHRGFVSHEQPRPRVRRPGRRRQHDPLLPLCGSGGPGAGVGLHPAGDRTSASEASLRKDYTLSQDAYGAGTQISQGANAFPVPGPGGRTTRRERQPTRP